MLRYFLISLWLSTCSNMCLAGFQLESVIQQLELANRPDVKRIPDPDGKLHIYALPVGQGDSHVVQCPSGTLSIVDLGSSNDEPDGYWHISELRVFFQGYYDRIRNVIVTHNHYDHYSFIPDVLNPALADLSGLEEIYISCTFNDMRTEMIDWVNAVDQGVSKLRLFNNGQPCGPNGVQCEPLNLCPNDPAISVLVMSANIGAHCSDGGNKNIDSLVFKVTYGSNSVIFNGDFEDETSSWNEDGPQKSLVDYYGQEMEVDVYKLAHHGASTLANKPVSRDAHMPKAVFVSGNPYYSYRHPRCEITDAFIQYVGTLCKPEITDNSHPNYCGDHPDSSVPAIDRVQRIFTCGDDAGGLRTDTVNDWAIYSTIPEANWMNIVELIMDGSRWGFRQNMLPFTPGRR